MTSTIPEETHVDVRIGVTYSAKELDVELRRGRRHRSDEDRHRDGAGRRRRSSGSPTSRVGQVGVPADKIAYVEFGRPDADRRIGFGG